ncbi:putative autotransporter adhesin-like protein [Gillisia mitskevichiae]|uniref:Putative autotransporter adhesin-like protein n=1 Tax=Gillisia mitskevichiae TaxID=270921 RepID=A0A495Q014_9FLAO|nr:head GIN domain-containing protein [Gillisia mitskevichiae]RKS56131.1 putative autotransporter adhesin-like protein [Gillisia mitskevichiae]
MKKLVFLILSTFLLSSCDAEDAPGCFKKAGDIVQDEVSVDTFNEIIVYEQVKLYIQQGPVRKVVIETGENLRKDVSVEVIDNRLSIRNGNSCNLVRDYELTKVYVTIPDLTWLQNSSGSAIETIGTLKLDELWLRSVNQENDLSIHTDGDFILELDVENLRITNDNVSNYFLSGKAENFDVFFAAGDSRLDASNLIVQKYEIFHRGTNKMIVFPVESIKGELRSSGNVKAKNRPPVVDVEEYYTGRLIFE